VAPLPRYHGPCMRATSCCAATLIVTVLLAACALLPKLEAPKLSIVGVQIVSGDLFTQRLKMRVHVQNPNDRALPVKGLEYTIEVEGQQLASGESAASFEVPALGEAEFDMNVTTSLAGALLKLLARGPNGLGQDVAYRIRGKVSLSEGLFRSIPFDEHGTFKLQ
jgi:LEA14-like dessication related protein